MRRRFWLWAYAVSERHARPYRVTAFTPAPVVSDIAPAAGPRTVRGKIRQHKRRVG